MAATAEQFRTDKAYTAGDLVLNFGLLYRFTTNHSAGAWNGSQVAEVDDRREQKITRMIAALDNITEGTAFVDTVKFTASLTEGTRYKMVLTDAPDPRR